MPEIDRRGFLKLVGASAGAAASAGCSDHVEALIPYVVQPEEITPGVPVYYASTCTECDAGCGIHVRTREGRPIKVEGNPEHPVNRGRLCIRGQATVQRTWSPDRFQAPFQRNGSGELVPVSWEEGIERVAAAIARAPQRAHLLGGSPGDTAGELLDRFVEAAGLGSRIVYEPFSAESVREATRLVFGVSSVPVFSLADADLILDFAAETFEAGPSPVEHQRQWAEARDVSAHPRGGARMVYIGPRLSMTASSSDDWLPARPGTEGLVALALARLAAQAGAGGETGRQLLAGALADVDVRAAAEASQVPAERLEQLGRAIAGARRVVALPPGVAVASRRAVASSAAVLLLNQVAGAVGQTVFVPPEPNRKAPSYREVLALVQAMQDGKVSVLLIHDANPVYTLPQAAGFAQALERVDLMVYFGSGYDETAVRADLVLPSHTPLESWGDVRPRPGVRSLVQPTLRPLYDTRQLGDTVLDIGRAMGESVAARLPSGSFRAVLEEAWAGADFRQALARGGVWEEMPIPTVQGASVAALPKVLEPKFTGEGDYTLVAFPTMTLYDGRGANLPVLQEIPDPVTHIAWDSWAEVSSASAERLGVETGDLLAIETSAGRLEVPAFVRGGIRDDVVAVPIGQGHVVGYYASKEGQGLPGQPRGVNVLDVLPAGVDESGGRAWLTERARVTATGRHRRLPMLQFNDNQRQRELGLAIPVAALAEPAVPDEAHGGHGAPAGDEHGDGHGASHEMKEPYDPAADAWDERMAEEWPLEPSIKPSPYRWGMSIDVDRCTGCSACIAACYVENNVPIVGEEETRRVRQMAWLRINRYVGDGEATLEAGRIHPAESLEQLGQVDVRNTPMLCQHCGSAPCEPVCPVIATYHNEEGLNAMIYNRCIGTRYCANNCPYKVRRFNYFDNQIHKWPAPMALGLNPDVTVRSQGVMEKCTFCIQRIQAARQEAKAEGRPIADGEVKTACQQTCPSDVITFGNWRNPESDLVKKAADAKRRYHALHVLNTRPAIAYLAKVTRGPVEEG